MNSADFVMGVAAQLYGVSVADLKSEARFRRLAWPRQRAMYVLHALCDHYSLPQIGRAFGGRDHTTVLHAIRAVEQRMANDPAEAEAVERLTALARDLVEAPILRRVDAMIAYHQARLEELYSQRETVTRASARSAAAAGTH